MKKNNLLQGAIVALLVASPFAAYADSQYPATDFEPKILYQDESAKSAAPVVKATPASVATPVAPVASVDDTKYPAANFEPKVLFKDDNYKPSKFAPSLAPTSAPAEYTSSAGAVVMEQAKSESGSNDSNLLILAVLAAVGGFVIFNKKGSSATSNETVDANRETGVTRYLNARIPKVSGVTKYLERTGTPTNVARYIAKQNIAQKTAQNDTDRG